MRQRAHIVSLALLLLALATPVLFLAGYALHGPELFARSTTHVAVALVGAALGAGAAAYLALRRDAPAIRLVAALALVALLGSLLTVRMAWGQGMSRAIDQLRRLPFDGNEVGVLICPANHTVKASREARDLQQLIERTVAGAGLDARIQVQLAYPVSTAAQAQVLARDRRASVIIWKQENTFHGRITEAYHVTSPGLAQSGITTEPVELLLVLLTDATYSLERSFQQGQGEIWPLAREVVAPLAIGMAFWPADEPLLTATLIDKALQVNGLTPAEQLALHEYQAATMLALGRADLASEQLAAVQSQADSARLAATLGAVAMMRREWEDAEREFMRAIEQDPSYVAAYCGLSSVLATRLDALRAVQAAQQAVALNKDLATPYAFLGLALERSGSIEGAIESYQRAAMLSGGNIGLYNAATLRVQTVRRNPPTPVPTATVRPTPTITPYPTAGLYTVQQGDSLGGIAAQFGVTVDAIMQINSITDRNAIGVGQKLKIPVSLD